jgi:hypothetical protein
MRKQIMKRALIVLAAAATLSAAVMPVTPAHAGKGGAVAAGVIGGLAAGAIIGSAVASQPRYYAPAPVYVAPPPPRCYWTRGEPVWDGYRGVWVRPRVQVCD